jgi:hypothetical protein
MRIAPAEKANSEKPFIKKSGGPFQKEKQPIEAVPARKATNGSASSSN